MTQDMFKLTQFFDIKSGKEILISSKLICFCKMCFTIKKKTSKSLLRLTFRLLLKQICKLILYGTLQIKKKFKSYLKLKSSNLKKADQHQMFIVLKMKFK